MIRSYWRPALRKLLLRLLSWTEQNGAKAAVQRTVTQRFWQKEIALPNFLVAGVSFIIVYAVLIMAVGLAWPRLVGLGLFLVMSLIFLEIYLKDDHPELVEDSEAMTLLGFIFISAALVMVLFKGWVFLDHSMALATPVAAFTILTGLLLSRKLAIIVTIILCFFLASINDLNLKYFVVHFFGALAGISAIPKIRNRAHVTELGLEVGLVNVIGVLAVSVFRQSGPQSLAGLGVEMLWGALSGILSAIIVLSTLPYLELFFSKTTNIKLLELADFNNPLLKKLMIEAPGTYHHSLLVASLAEQAAESINANSLLARVGAYYHDIGKLSKPEYFIENQQAMGNPHDPLAPTMSSLILISHVKEGVALAQKGNLDKVIIDCIEQHHGTSIIHYFYHRALEQDAEVKPETFRYPGPNPKRKETAILMLADSIEAASRSLDDPSPSRIKEMVYKIINNKFTDGQFSECPITLHDLGKIAESLVLTLNGVFHARIEYEESTEQKIDDKKQKTDDKEAKAEKT